jgi:hypothetical protein
MLRKLPEIFQFSYLVENNKEVQLNFYLNLKYMFYLLALLKNAVSLNTYLFLAK